MTNFGYSSVGASQDNPADNWIWCKATSLPAASGALSQIQAYLGPKMGSPTVCFALYDEASSAPHNLLVANETPVTVGGSFGWVTQSITYPLVAGTQYWFGLRIHDNAATVNDCYMKYDSNGGATEMYYHYEGTGSVFPSTCTLDHPTTNERVSIYGTYASGAHVVTGRGNFAITSPAVLSIALTGIPARLTYGAAEPKNWYHVGMLRWGTANGVFTAYPVTADTDLVILPAGMTILYYEFASGITATITERSTV